MRFAFLAILVLATRCTFAQPPADAQLGEHVEAAALLQLFDEDKLSRDDDVTKYVPEAPTNTRHITVRQLLNHTSGIYSFTSLPNAKENERLNLNHDQVLALFRDQPPDFAPGTSWRYNNSGFDARCEAAHPITKLAHALSSARN